MSRWRYFPMIAVPVAQLYGQQAAPVPSEAEKALRDRVEQFYQLQMDKKYRQAEAYVAEDTKDLYFAGKKPELQGFTVQKVELLDNNTKAKVTVKTKSLMMMMGVGRLPFEIPTETLWKLENGSWVWYVDTKAPLQTPFGAVALNNAPGGAAPPDVKSLVAAADVNAFQHQVTIDKTSVTLTKDEPSATVTITNGMPGFVEVALDKGNVAGILMDIDKTHVGAGEKAVIRFSRGGAERGKWVVHLSVAPLNIDFDVQVRSD